LLSFLSFTLYFSLIPKKLVPILQLDPVPEDSVLYMQGPKDLAIDSDGRFYVVDSVAKTVFVWNREGRFLGTMGKGGQGPGEFRFSKMGGAQAFLTVFKGQVLVFDGATNAVNTFGKDLTFKESRIINIPRGSTDYFRLTPAGEFLVYQQKWGDVPLRQVVVYGKEGNALREIVSVPDQGYSLRKNKEGGYGGLNINAFCPRLTVHYDRGTGQVLAGSGDRPEYEVYDLTGKLLRKVSVRMIQQEVTAEDKSEYENVEWVRNGLASGYIQLSYPKTKPYFTHLLPMKDKGHLVLFRSPHLAKMRGIRVDDQGKTLSRFSLDCGENGDLFSVDGRLFAVMVDDEGEFVIREMGYGETGS